MAADPRPSQGQRFTGPRAAELVALIEPVVTEHGLFLEELELKPGGSSAVLRVTVDYISGTEQVDLDTLAEVSQSISERLDEAEQQGTEQPGQGSEHAGAEALVGLDSYELEVTTPGATRPLTQPRHFLRNLGRLLEIELDPEDGGRTLLARLKKVDDDGVEIAEQKPAPKKGMPVRYSDPVHIGFASIARARVQVEFSHTD